MPNLIIYKNKLVDAEPVARQLETIYRCDRGGSFSNEVYLSKTYYRDWFSDTYKSKLLGIRLVLRKVNRNVCDE